MADNSRKKAFNSATRAIENFEKNLPEIKALLNEIKDEVKGRGVVKGINSTTQAQPKKSPSGPMGPEVPTGNLFGLNTKGPGGTPPTENMFAPKPGNLITGNALPQKQGLTAHISSEVPTGKLNNSSGIKTSTGPSVGPAPNVNGTKKQNKNGQQRTKMQNELNALNKFKPPDSEEKQPQPGNQQQKPGLYVNPIRRKNIQQKMENKNIDRQLQELEKEVKTKMEGQSIQNEEGDKIEQNTKVALEQGEEALAQAGIETPQAATPQSYDLILHPILQEHFDQIPIQKHKYIHATKIFKTLQTDTSNIDKQIFDSVKRFFQKNNINTEAPETQLYKSSIVNAYSIIRNGILKIKPGILIQKEKNLYWYIYNFSNNKLIKQQASSTQSSKPRGGKRTVRKRKVKRSNKRKTTRKRRSS